FKKYVSEELHKPQLIEMRRLRSNVASELRTLERLAAKQSDVAESNFGIHSSSSLPSAATTDSITTQPHEKGFDGVGGGVPVPSGSRLIHALRSSNLPFYLAVWTIAKQNCKGVVAFGKRF